MRSAEETALEPQHQPRPGRRCVPTTPGSTLEWAGGAAAGWEQKDKGTRLPGSSWGFLRVTPAVGLGLVPPPHRSTPSPGGFSPTAFSSGGSQSPSLQLEASPAAVSPEAGVPSCRYCLPEAGGKEAGAVRSPTGVPTSLPTHTQHGLPAERLSRGSHLLKFTSCR